MTAPDWDQLQDELAQDEDRELARRYRELQAKLREAGRRGGSSRSEKKRRASIRNLGYIEREEQDK